jgi:8-oxo-dGTP diphosphatase
MVVTDVLLTRHQESEILLILRKKEPFRDYWALPGGFIEMEEDLEESAFRELYEETGIKPAVLHLFRTYGKPGRDPRGRTISVVFSGKAEDHTQPEAGDNAADARWFSRDHLPLLAFDHAEIIRDFFDR